MDAIWAAVIGVIGPVLVVAVPRWVRRWKGWRKVRRLRRDHERVIAESLLAVTLRLSALEESVAELWREMRSR